jgi:hypothetical protein
MRNAFWRQKMTSGAWAPAVPAPDRINNADRIKMRTCMAPALAKTSR